VRGILNPMNNNLDVLWYLMTEHLCRLPSPETLCRLLNANRVALSLFRVYGKSFLQRHTAQLRVEHKASCDELLRAVNNGESTVQAHHSMFQSHRRELLAWYIFQARLWRGKLRGDFGESLSDFYERDPYGVSVPRSVPDFLPWKSASVNRRRIHN